MKVFDRYVFGSLLTATIFMSVILAVVILLTQSLRFLELVIESGASSGSFWVLTFLALPRFFEVIMPLSLMAAVIFVYNRMTSDSELVVIRSSGYSPMALAKPAILLAIIVTLFLWAMTMWVAPKSLSNMQKMSQVIRAQFSSLLFREGIFNQVGQGLTVYIRERHNDGELLGLMIHDTREVDMPPSTILAKRGALVANEEGQQVLVYDGSRQELDPRTGAMRRLNFERYTIDLPESNPVRERWSEPDERTIFELLSPDLNDQRDLDNLREFKVEIHRRFISPLLAIAFTLLPCAILLVGPVDRRGQGKRILMAVAGIVILQGLFIASFNLARQTDWGLFCMYLIVVLPFAMSSFVLSGMSEKIRRQILYKPQEKEA